jgi:hypothetical protein
MNARRRILWRSCLVSRLACMYKGARHPCCTQCCKARQPKQWWLFLQALGSADCNNSRLLEHNVVNPPPLHAAAVLLLATCCWSLLARPRCHGPLHTAAALAAAAALMLPAAPGLAAAARGGPPWLRAANSFLDVLHACGFPALLSLDCLAGCDSPALAAALAAPAAAAALAAPGGAGAWLAAMAAGAACAAALGLESFGAAGGVAAGLLLLCWLAGDCKTQLSHRTGPLRTNGARRDAVAQVSLAPTRHLDAPRPLSVESRASVRAGGRSLRQLRCLGADGLHPPPPTSSRGRHLLPFGMHTCSSARQHCGR